MEYNQVLVLRRRPTDGMAMSNSSGSTEFPQGSEPRHHMAGPRTFMATDSAPVKARLRLMARLPVDSPTNFAWSWRCFEAFQAALLLDVRDRRWRNDSRRLEMEIAT